MPSKSALIDTLTTRFLEWQKKPLSHSELSLRLTRLLDSLDPVVMRAATGQIPSAKSERHGTETRRLTILVADIRGFSSLASFYPAESIVSLLDQYFSVMGELIIKHGGVVDKCMGDTVMAVFGLEPTQTDDVGQAIACAVGMQQVMPAINYYGQQLGMPPVYIGIGINTGAVVAGDIGGVFHREYTVVGEEVKLAARIAAHSLRGQISLSQSTWERARGYIEVGPGKQVHLGGREPVSLYVLKETRRPKRLLVPRCEERKGPRVNVNIPLSFQRLSGSSVLPEEHKGEILDISYSGMKARIPVYLEPYSNIKFPLSVARADNDSNPIYAKVLRSNMRKNDYTASLEFTAVPPQGQVALRDFVDRMIN